MRTRAIILKKQNTNEYDQLVTCYTEEFGKVVGIAKSILKPSSIQSMHLDIFNLVEFEFVNGLAMPIITGAQAEETYTNLKNDLPSLAVAYFFTETIDRLAFDYQKDEGLWSFLVSLVADLNRGESDTKEFLKTKQIELLDILGYSPNLKECGFCSQAPVGFVAYNVQARGIVCEDCFLSGGGGIVVKNDPDFSRYDKDFIKIEDPRFTNRALREVNREDFLSSPVLSSIFESLVEKKIHSLNLFNSVLELR
jgi:DNA repair protein RecO